jgi:putative transposase
VRSNDNGSGAMREFEVWLSRAEVQELLGISHQALIKAIQKGKFVVQISHGNGGKQYRIALSSLPGSAQVKWIQANEEKAREFPEEYVEKLSPQARFEVARLRAPIESIGKETILMAKERPRDVELIHKALNPPPGMKKWHWIQKVAEEAGITVQALYKKLKAYKEGGLAGVLKKKGPKGFKSWSPEALEYMQGVYLRMIREGGDGSKKKAYEAVLAEAKKRGWKVGSQSSAYEYLAKLNPLLEKFARGGARALDNVFYIVRQYNDLEPFECIVGDQHRFNFFVQDVETGKVFRPEGYFWVDLRTRLVYGFAVADRYNAYLMGVALRMGLHRFGKFKTCYTDNGKPEVSRYFNEIIKELNAYGMKESDISELYRTDGGYAVEAEEGEVVNVVKTREAWHRYARPYNAKAKLIERFFRSLEGILLELGCPGHVKDIVGTTEEKHLADERIKELIREGKLLSFEEFLLKVFQAVEVYNERRHYALKRSPMQELERAIKARFVPVRLVEEELDFVLMARTVRSVNRGRILLDGVLYEGEDLETGLWDIPDKTRVEVRYDLYDRSRIYVIRPDGRIVELREVQVSSMKDKEKTAELIERKRKMIARIREEYKRLIKSVPSVIEYSPRTKAVLEQKKRSKDKTKEQASLVLDREAFEQEVQRRIELTKSLNDMPRKTELVRPSVFASKRERYKYLIDCMLEGYEITDEDRLFMKRYEEEMSLEEKVWWENYIKVYPYQRRAVC